LAQALLITGRSTHDESLGKHVDGPDVLGPQDEDRRADAGDIHRPLLVTPQIALLLLFRLRTHSEDMKLMRQRLKAVLGANLIPQFA
jgi:hypothetical protein